MFLDIGPLRRNVAFRRLFASQFISGLGSMVSYVAVPWQIYELTHSNAQVRCSAWCSSLPSSCTGCWAAP